MMNTKTCKKCGQTKPTTEFYNMVSRAGRLYKKGECRACCNERAKRWQKRAIAASRVAQPHAWTPDEEQWLIGHYLRGFTALDCALILAHSYKSVHARVFMLGITGRDDWRKEEVDAA